MAKVITRDPRIMHGEACFAGTRVTAKSFFDHIEAGYTLDEFLEQFPSVRREQVEELLAALREGADRSAEVVPV